MVRRTALIAVVLAAALAVPSSPAPPPQRPDDCAAPPAGDVESLVASGRYWHALRAAPALPPDSSPPSLTRILLRLRIAEGLREWSSIDGILARAAGADTIPQLVAAAARQDERAERWAAAAARYRRLGSLPRADGDLRTTAAARLAVVLERLGSRDSAAAAWRRAAQAVPAIADWFALRRAELEGDTTLAFASVAEARTPGAAERADDLMARRREAAGNLTGALEVYLRRGRPLDVARVEVSLGRRGQARQLADSLLLGDPAQPVALLAANLLVEQLAPLTEAELVGVARAYRARGDRITAERYAGRAVAGRNAGVAAWVELAAIRSGRRQYGAALEALDSAEARGRRRHEAPAMPVALARVQVLGAADRWDAANRLVASLAMDSPGDSDVAAAMLVVANHERSRGTAENERTLYTALVERFRATPAATFARFRLALADYGAGRIDSAAAGVAAVIAADTAHRLGRAPRYWDARLKLERRDPGAAVALGAIAAEEPAGYYGVRSRELLGDSLQFASDTAPPPPGAFPASLARERVLLLARAGLETEARAEALGWTRGTAVTPQVLVAAAGAAAEAGFGREAIQMGEAARRRAGLSREVAHALFPLPYRPVIMAEAAEQCVDPLLMAAIVRQESRFDPRAQSRAGARGMSQVLPRTGAELSQRLRLRPWNPQLLYVPDFNLHLGARYVRERLVRDSLPVYALLASYDAGRTAIVRSRQLPEFRDVDLFVERLSIAETRDYVRNVYANYQWYRRLYGAPAGGR
jgi:soluble lytic murein transglycosylase